MLRSNSSETRLHIYTIAASIPEMINPRHDRFGVLQRPVNLPKWSVRCSRRRTRELGARGACTLRRLHLGGRRAVTVGPAGAGRSNCTGASQREVGADAIWSARAARVTAVADAAAAAVGVPVPGAEA